LHDNEQGITVVVMSELDESQEAARNVDRITDSEPVNGEDLLSSPDLKRQMREIKALLKAGLSDELGEKPVE
jgi:hypothetical protein